MARLTQIKADAAAAIAQMGYGTRISHDAMSTLVESRPGTNAYRGRVSDVRDILRSQYHMWICTIPSEGFEIVPPENVIRECENEFYRGVNYIWRGTLHSKDIDTDLISDPQKRASTIETAQKMAALAGMLKHGLAFNPSDKQILTA